MKKYTIKNGQYTKIVIILKKNIFTLYEENKVKKLLLHCAMEKEGRQIAEKLGLKQIKENLYRLDNALNNLNENVINADAIDLLITGIGKQRTAIELTKYLENEEKPDLIINIGYAGSTNTKTGTWVSICKSYNYEWNIPGEERYSMTNLGNQELMTIDSLEKIPCYTAEEFVTYTDIKEDVIFDMELHSLAIICDMYKIKLLSIKKVSDNLNLKDYYSNLDMKDVMELESGIMFLDKINI